MTKKKPQAKDFALPPAALVTYAFLTSDNRHGLK